MHNFVQRSFTSVACPGTHASFFILQYFLIKQFFPRKPRKTVWWHISPFFWEKRRLDPKINITFFTTNEMLNISKKATFLAILQF